MVLTPPSDALFKNGARRSRTSTTRQSVLRQSHDAFDNFQR
jgi:hypothetical protein